MPDIAAPAQRRVIVTRPQPQADEWVARLQAAGASALALPLLRVMDDPAFAPQVDAAWQRLSSHDLVMFVSPNAVLRFFARQPAGAGWPAHVLAAATGPGTVAALQAAGVPAPSIRAPRPSAPRFDAEALWADALAQQAWAGRSALVVRGATGRDWLGQQLLTAGARVDYLSAYRQAAPVWDAPHLALLSDVATDAPGHAWLFSSSNAITHLAQHAGAGTQWHALTRTPALATHPRIANTARQAGWATVILVSPDPATVARAMMNTPALALGPSIESPAVSRPEPGQAPS